MTTPADQAASCGGSRFCKWAKGCADCRPETWAEFQPLPPLGMFLGSYAGASYESVRKSVREIAAHLRQVADELEAAHGDGFRFYEIESYGRGTIRLAKGRVPR